MLLSAYVTKYHSLSPSYIKFLDMADGKVSSPLLGRYFHFRYELFSCKMAIYHDAAANSLTVATAAAHFRMVIASHLIETGRSGGYLNRNLNEEL